MSADLVKFGNLKMRSCAFFRPLPMFLMVGVSQSRDWLSRRVAFWRCAWCWLNVLPGLKVARQSWTVSAVGGRAGLLARLQNLM